MAVSRITWNASFPALLILLLLGAGDLSAQTFPARTRASAVFVGHSLINFDMPSYVQAIADSRGLGFERAVQVLIGSPLSINLANCRRATSSLEIDPSKFTFSCDAIASGSTSGPWDTLILTDANGTIASNRQWNRTEEAISTFASQFLQRNASGRVMLFTTWESLTTYGSNWSATQQADLRQYEEMAAGATALSRASGFSTTIEVIPVNIAIRDLLVEIAAGRIPGVNNSAQIFSDDVHMTALGNYFVSSVVFSAVFNRSPEGASGSVANVSPATATALQRLAWQVVSSYRGAASAPAPATPRAPTLLRVD